MQDFELLGMVVTGKPLSPDRGFVVSKAISCYNQTMYKYHVLRSSPIAFWQLDDDAPFDERSGYGHEANVVGTPSKSVPLVNGAEFSTVLDSSAVASFECPVFKSGQERRPFALEAWVLPVPKSVDTATQQILSHSDKYDGLTINGKTVRFRMEFEGQPPAEVSYDLGENQLAHVVGIHNGTDIELWVNGRVVASTALSEEQKFALYPPSDGKLYSGKTTSSHGLAVNGVAVYNLLSADNIEKNYRAGIETIGQSRIPVQKSGVPIELSSSNGSVFHEETWSVATDFARGLAENVQYAAEFVSPTVVDGISSAGKWSVAIPLDSTGHTSIYGVALSWSGTGVAVECSIDETNWVEAKNGELVQVIAPNLDPTDKDLQVRVSFDGGIVDDPSRLESLTLIGYLNNNVSNITLNPITLSHPALVRKDFETNLFRDDNGVFLGGGSITIGPDTSEDPEPVRTIELWVKPRASGFTIGGPSGMTMYRNGVVDSSWPVGEWSLIHVVSDTDITSDVTITGDAIIGQMAFYDLSLTADDITHLYRSYNGTTAFRVSDSDVVSISELSEPVYVYAHDWSISQAG